MSDDIKERLQDLVGEFRNAMLVTRDEGGTLQSRPMHIAEHDESSGLLTFASSIDTGKVVEIRVDPDCCVTLQDGAVFVSLSGTANVSQDRDRIESLWNKSWEVWFPDGPSQDDLCLIEFDPSIGEYWDNSGIKGIRYLWKSATALLGDRNPDPKRDDDVHAETTL